MCFFLWTRLTFIITLFNTHFFINFLIKAKPRNLRNFIPFLYNIRDSAYVRKLVGPKKTLPEGEIRTSAKRERIVPIGFATPKLPNPPFDHTHIWIYVGRRDIVMNRTVTLSQPTWSRLIHSHSYGGNKKIPRARTFHTFAYAKLLGDIDPVLHAASNRQIVALQFVVNVRMLLTASFYLFMMMGVCIWTLYYNWNVRGWWISFVASVRRTFSSVIIWNGIYSRFVFIGTWLKFVLFSIEYRCELLLYGVFFRKFQFERFYGLIIHLNHNF